MHSVWLFRRLWEDRSDTGPDCDIESALYRRSQFVDYTLAAIIVRDLHVAGCAMLSLLRATGTTATDSSGHRDGAEEWS